MEDLHGYDHIGKPIQNRETSRGQTDSPMLVEENGSTVPSHPLIPSLRRLTVPLAVISVLSLIGLLFIISFVTFLWYSNDSNSTWHSIVEADWLTGAVTLSAFVIRLATTAQAALAMSMLAFLAIENGGVHILHAPEVSFARFSNAGPLTFLWAYRKQPKSAVLLPLLAILSFSTLGLQLSSTLLVSDIATATITSSSTTSSIPYRNSDPTSNETENFFCGSF